MTPPADPVDPSTPATAVDLIADIHTLAKAVAKFADSLDETNARVSELRSLRRRNGGLVVVAVTALAVILVLVVNLTSIASENRQELDGVDRAAVNAVVCAYEARGDVDAVVACYERRQAEAEEAGR